MKHYTIARRPSVVRTPVCQYEGNERVIAVDCIHDDGGEYEDIFNKRFDTACDMLSAQIENLKGADREFTGREKMSLVLSLNALLELNEVLFKNKRE